jgi:transposase
VGPTNPAALLAENAQLRAERDGAFRQLTELNATLAKLAETMAGQNERLDQVVSMLRRREAQLRRAETENRKLRRALGLTTDDPEDDEPDTDDPPPPGPAAPSSPEDASTAQTGAKGGASGPASKPLGKGKRPRTRGGRRPPAPHLPEDVERVAACACGRCGSERLLKKDVLVSRKYDVVSSYVRCRTIEREIVVCADCGGRTTAEMPPMPWERSLFTSRFLAWLVVMKFVLLVPLDRIRRLLLSQGVDLAESTLVHLIAKAAELSDPVDGEHWKQLLAGSYLCFDGTGLKALVLGQSKAWDGYLEVFTREALTVFQFDMTKHADRLEGRLKRFGGTMVCDAETRNRSQRRADRPIANCNAHPVRKFRDAQVAHPDLAAQGGRFLQVVYALEARAQADGLRGEALQAFRRRWIGRVLRRFRTWLTLVVARPLPPSDPVRKAAKYYLNHYEGLTAFVDDPSLPLDNNASEREFQNHAKLRLQSLFAGSPEGAHRWATLLGVVRTAQKVGVDVLAYLTWLFDRRGTHRHAFDLTAAELTPMAYRAQLETSALAA